VVINEPALALFDENVSLGQRIGVVRPDGTLVNATLVGVVESNGGPFGDSSFPEVYVPTDPFYTNQLESPNQGVEQRVYPTLMVVATDFPTVEAVEGAWSGTSGGVRRPRTEIGELRSPCGRHRTSSTRYRTC